MSNFLRCAAPCVALAATAYGQTLTLTDHTASSGVNVYQEPMIGTPFAPMVGGGAVGDFNRDGFMDIFVLAGGNAPDCLFINNGSGGFSEQAIAWGVAVRHRGYGAAVGDYDKDGWPDIYVTSAGPYNTAPQVGQNKLYHNNGNGTFTNVAVAAGVNVTSPSSSDSWGANWGDYDLDGDLDLAVGSWLTFSGGNKLFRNNGNGTFTDVTTTAILFDMTGTKGFTPNFVDMNGDMYPELLWVSDAMTSKYLINNGNGTFSEYTAGAGVGLDQFGMGQTIADFNGDGLLDWYVTSIYRPSDPVHLGNMLYINQGNHQYQEIASTAGVNNGGWGWGTVGVDMNHDGLTDIVETNGWPNDGEWEHDTTRVWINNGDLTFSDVAIPTGLYHDGQGRGIARFDLENDGDQDIVILGFEQSVVIVRNDLSGPNTNWLRIFLDTDGVAGLAPNGIGARVIVTSDGYRQVRQVAAESQYLSSSEPSAHFGLGSNAQASVKVLWPNGQVTKLANVAANRTLTIRPPAAPPPVQHPTGTATPGSPAGDASEEPTP